MREKFNRFMIGRYGTDDLSKFLMIAAVVLMVINLFARIPVGNTLVLILIALVYIRMFSKNIQQRYQENLKYLNFCNRIRAFFKKKKNRAADMKTHHIFRCPSCKQKIRVPRGKGKIMITCPKCKTEFQKKS